jgi:alkylhydroperoxidase family enzyme
MDPKYAERFHDLERRLLEQPGTLDPAIRRAAAAGEGVPDAFASYVNTVRRRAYKVTDDDVARLIAAGSSEDQVFELTVTAAFGAARDRLRAGLDAMGAAVEAPSARTERRRS